MKTLHLYLTRQVVASLLLTLAVFTFVFLLGNLLNEVLALLVKGQVSLRIVLEAIGLLVPYVLVFALPMALLASTLLVFGRFSADQELTAARAGGVSLVSLVMPIILLSLALSGVSAYVNLEFAPRCRMAYKDLFFKLTAEFASAQLPEGCFIKDFPGYVIYIGKNDKGRLENILLIQRESTNRSMMFRATSGTFQVDATNRQMLVELVDVTGFYTEGERTIPAHISRYPITLSFGDAIGDERKPKITELPFNQLRAELRSLEDAIPQAAPTEKLNREQLAKRRQEMKKQTKDLASLARVQLHRQVAFSFACFGFVLVGIPLGIRVHRRETNVSFAMAMVLVLIYYSFLVAAQSLASRSELAPHLIVWIPNFIFQAVGAVLLWRANRGF